MKNVGFAGTPLNTCVVNVVHIIPSSPQCGGLFTTHSAQILLTHSFLLLFLPTSHVFSVIKCFQSPGARRGGSGWRGFENRMVCVCFFLNSHAQNHQILLGPSSQISICFHSGMQMNLWRIAMIGFIMLPAVSEDDEFGILR